jgi:hypothetical protein
MQDKIIYFRTMPEPNPTNENAPILTIEYKNQKPVELSDLTASLNAINNQYKRFAESRSDEFEIQGEVKLFIREMRHGSIIADLIDNAWWIIPAVHNINSLFEFARNLKRLIDFYTGLTNDEPVLSKQELKEISQIVEPVAKDNAAQLNISTTYNAEVHYHLHLTSEQSNAIQGRVARRIEEMQEPQSNIKEGVALYWFQARGGDTHSTAGDKGVIESVSSKPVKVFFANDDLKAATVLSSENPFKYAYIVDVQIETVENSPVLYKVMRLHDKIERPTLALPPAQTPPIEEAP